MNTLAKVIPHKYKNKSKLVNPTFWGVNLTFWGVNNFGRLYLVASLA
jgi:hypothetical protein